MGVAALELAARGWFVLPCRWEGPNAKAPLTRHGHYEASRDVGTIAAWWARYPEALVGLAIPEHVLILDIDPRNGGNIEALESVVGPLPSTLTAWSGRRDGGRHLYYLRPDRFRVSRDRIPRGIDVKTRGYVIAPPSPHPSTGEPYWWGRGTFVAPLPPAASNALRAAPAPARPSSLSRRGGGIESLANWVGNLEPSKRNDGLFWACCRAFEGGYEVDSLAVAAAAAGLPEDEIARTVQSARRTIGGSR